VKTQYRDHIYQPGIQQVQAVTTH